MSTDPAKWEPGEDVDADATVRELVLTAYPAPHSHGTGAPPPPEPFRPCWKHHGAWKRAEYRVAFDPDAEHWYLLTTDWKMDDLGIWADPYIEGDDLLTLFMLSAPDESVVPALEQACATNTAAALRLLARPLADHLGLPGIEFAYDATNENYVVCTGGAS